MYGNVLNRLMENGQSKPPEAGDGVTEFLYSDRHAYTVVEVVGPKKIKVRRDNAIRTNGACMTDCQMYHYEPDTEAPVVTLRLNKAGKWKRVGDPGGSTYVVGLRDEYYDYSF